MKMMTVFNDPEGETRFGEETVELRAGPMNVEARHSAPEACKRFYFSELSPGYKSSKDFAGRRQVSVLISGELEVRASNEETMIVKPGDIVRLEDTAYETPSRSMRVIGDEPARILVVQLE